MGQRAPPNQHSKNHPPAIDQAELDFTFHRANANLHRDEDALLELTARRPNLTAPRNPRLDRHPAITFAATEADLEAHSPPCELPDIFDVQRAAARTGVDFCAQTQDSPRGNVD